MELYIDISKGLNTGKLVKKPIQVQGKHGKTFTRMQWVNPADLSSGHGVREIKSKESYQHALKQGIHSHPKFKQFMKDQKANMNHHHTHHPSIFLPETEDSHKAYHAEKEDSKHPHSTHYSHETQHEDADPMESADVESFHEDTHDALEDLDKVSRTGNLDDDWINVHESLNRHVDQISDSVKDMVEQFNSDNRFIKNVKKTAVSHIRKKMKRTAMQESVPGSSRDKVNVPKVASQHPVFARETCKKLLGDNYDAVMAFYDNANLTINHPDNYTDSIRENGYTASTAQSYVDKYFTEGGKEMFTEIMENHEGDDMDTLMDKMLMAGEADDSPWGEVMTRMQAEYDAIGLEPEDAKPVYVAFNPTGDPKGGAKDYGRGVTEVDESILHDCTSTMDDSFMDLRSNAHVDDMEHLKHIHMLKKMMSSYEEDAFSAATKDFDKDTIPVELHYHKPSVEPHLLREGGAEEKVDNRSIKEQNKQETAKITASFAKMKEDLDLFGVDTSSVKGPDDLERLHAELMENIFNQEDK